MRSLVLLGTAAALMNVASAQEIRVQEIRVLSAGAVEPGLRAAIALYPQKTSITFNTAPQIRERIENKREQFDVVIAPPAVMDAFAPAGRVESERAMLVFNRATGGQYIESMLRKIGVYDQIEKKTTRYASAGEVMEHLLRGKGRELGFAPIPEIALYKEKGLRYAGPLPADVQQYNACVAAPMRGAADAPAAAALVRFLATAESKRALASGGVE